MLHGLAPVAAGDARLLVLGTMPGVESLRRQQYYAHPRNQFWRLVFAALAAQDPAAYTERVAFLIQHGIALWDVLEACEREGSLDARIVRGTERPNDILGFLRGHARIRAVALNGGKADRLFRSRIVPHLGDLGRGLEILPLPSSSPAHTVPFAAKLGRWRAAFAEMEP